MRWLRPRCSRHDGRAFPRLRSERSANSVTHPLAARHLLAPSSRAVTPGPCAWLPRRLLLSPTKTSTAWSVILVAPKLIPLSHCSPHFPSHQDFFSITASCGERRDPAYLVCVRRQPSSRNISNDFARAKRISDTRYVARPKNGRQGKLRRESIPSPVQGPARKGTMPSFFFPPRKSILFHT